MRGSPSCAARSGATTGSATAAAPRATSSAATTPTTMPAVLLDCSSAGAGCSSVGCCAVVEFVAAAVALSLAVAVAVAVAVAAAVDVPPVFGTTSFKVGVGFGAGGSSGTDGVVDGCATDVGAGGICAGEVFSVFCVDVLPTVPPAAGSRPRAAEAALSAQVCRWRMCAAPGNGSHPYPSPRRCRT